jgi:hypothetical protein
MEGKSQKTPARGEIEMNKARFDKAFGRFIRTEEPPITPETFFQVLAESERERIPNTIELRATIVEGQLQFEPSSEISVHDNEIVLGNHRIVVKVS